MWKNTEQKHLFPIKGQGLRDAVEYIYGLLDCFCVCKLVISFTKYTRIHLSRFAS